MFEDIHIQSMSSGIEMSIHEAKKQSRCHYWTGWRPLYVINNIDHKYTLLIKRDSS